jgi:hypothetical protein
VPWAFQPCLWGFLTKKGERERGKKGEKNKKGKEGKN